MSTRTIRPYAHDSVEAAARIVILGLLSDGYLQNVELDALRRVRAMQRLGIGEEEFDRVMEELCDDLHREAPLDEGQNSLVSVADLQAMFAEIQDPRLRFEICSIVVDVIRADRSWHQGESVLLRTLLKSWPAAANAPAFFPQASLGLMGELRSA